MQAPVPQMTAGDIWPSSAKGAVDAPVGLAAALAAAKAPAVTPAAKSTTVHCSVSKPSPMEEVIELLSGDEGDPVDIGCLAKAAHADGVPRISEGKVEDSVYGELVALDDDTVGACLPTSTVEEGLEPSGATSKPNRVASEYVSSARTLTGTLNSGVNLAETDGKSAAVATEDEEASSPPVSKELAACAAVASTGGAEVPSLHTGNTVQGSDAQAVNKPVATNPPPETNNTAAGCSVPR